MRSFIKVRTGVMRTITTISTVLREQSKGICNGPFLTSRDIRTPARWGGAVDVLHVLDQQGAQGDSLAYVKLLQRCTKVKDLAAGRQVHCHIICDGLQSNIYVANTLIKMYSHCGSLRDARQVFEKIHKKTVVSWNAMVGGCAQHGLRKEAFMLYTQMLSEGWEPNKITYLSLLAACDTPAALNLGKEVHADITKARLMSDVSIGNALVSMYGKCGSIKHARQVFDRMVNRDIFSWTIMLGRYAESGHGEEAFEIFRQMGQEGLKPNRVTYLSILDVCSSPADLKRGKEIETLISSAELLSDTSLGNALVHMYAKCGSIIDAQHTFDRLVNRDVISWNALIGAYAKSADNEKAFDVFHQMQLEGMQPNSITYLNMLSACGDLEQVRKLNVQVIEAGIFQDVKVGNALIHLYAKCGSIEESQQVFTNMVNRDIISWNAMIGGLAQHGFGSDALQLFTEMITKGLRPNEVTYVGVLSACSHTGLVDEGRHYFSSMSHDHGIIPRMEHYGCMVGLLGRAGYLEEAEHIVESMPFEANASVLGSLLGACRVHGNVIVAERVADRCLRADPQDAAVYVLLSHIYAAAGMWDNVSKVGNLMKKRGVKKEAGRSWIKVKDKVHNFVAEDRSHPQTEKIYAELESLTKKMKRAGYVPDTKFVMHDVDKCHKEEAICLHSEKLAIAYGLISTPPGTQICIFKNLRVCGDCHTATKYISSIARREIVARDASRFHHFKDGICSCGDYW